EAGRTGRVLRSLGIARGDEQGTAYLLESREARVVGPVRDERASRAVCDEHDRVAGLRDRVAEPADPVPTRRRDPIVLHHAAQGGVALFPQRLPMPGARVIEPREDQGDRLHATIMEKPARVRYGSSWLGP